jgi:hypothetical protein
LDPPASTKSLGEQLHDVPWVRISVPSDFMDTLYVLTPRQERKRNRAKAKARKMKNPAYRRRYYRRQVIVIVSLIIIVLGGIMKAPDDPFGKHPVPTTPTVTTVTPPTTG